MEEKLPRGLMKFGFIFNLHENAKTGDAGYLQKLRDMAGEKIALEELNSHIDTVFADRLNQLLCYDVNKQPIDSSSDQIAQFLVDTGYTAQDSGEKLYALFHRHSKSSPVSDITACYSSDRNGWIGVQIVTRAEFEGKPAAAAALRNTSCAATAGEHEQPKTISEFAAGINYVEVGRRLRKFLTRPVDVDKCTALLEQSYQSALEAGGPTLLKIKLDDSVEDIPCFVLKDSDDPKKDLLASNGKRLFIYSQPNVNKMLDQPWYGAFILTESKLIDALLDAESGYYRVGYFRFSSPVSATAFFKELAEMASPEKWNFSANNPYPYPVLRGFLEHTYYRLLEEDRAEREADKPRTKIIDREKQRYFNSGLLDRYFNQIIIEGTLNRRVFEYDGIGRLEIDMLDNLTAKKSNSLFGRFRETELPQVVRYFMRREDVVFDATLDIALNDDHIYVAGLTRGRLPSFVEKYEKLRNATPNGSGSVDNTAEMDALIGEIQDGFLSAIRRAKLMSERNYKLAVPMYYQEADQICFLLPIYLNNKNNDNLPECALVLSLDKSEDHPHYRGETILTLDMAYQDARQIAKPDIFWLNEV